MERIHQIDAVPISRTSETKIRAATLQDETSQVLLQYVSTGWPQTIQECEPAARSYYSVRHEITCDESGLLYKGLRIIIPRSIRAEIREKLHAAHTGVESTLRRARECVYWPGISAELKDYVAKCETCNAFSKAQPKETLKPHPVVTRPFEKIGCDIFTVDGRDFLCTVDYYSDYFEIDNLQGKKDAPAVISRLKRHFSTHGIPEVIMSDNGPPYNSAQFADFLKDLDIQHVTSSPEFPQSNGKAESAVKVAKGLIRKSKKAGQDFYMNLLVWRNTPTVSMDSTPAQRMFGRRMRTNIPVAKELLQPQIVERVAEKKTRKQQAQARYYNRGAKDLDELHPGDIVRVHLKPRREWTNAKVREKIGIRSYRIVTEDGVAFRRNRRQLKKTSENFEEFVDSPMTDMRENRPQRDNRNRANDNPPLRRSTRMCQRPTYLHDYVTK